MRLLLTRPRQESEALAQMLKSRGHESVIEPLLLIEFRRITAIESGIPQALIITSANGAQALSAHIQAHQYRRVPVYAVGQATADALGQFNVVHVGSNGVAALEQTICRELSPEKGALLYVHGVHVAGNLAHNLSSSGFRVKEITAYEAVESDAFSPAVIEDIRNNQIDGVVLFSPRTAAVFSKLVKKAGLIKNLSRVTFYCLSQNVSDNIEIAGKNLTDQMIIAETPALTSLLKSIREK